MNSASTVRRILVQIALTILTIGMAPVCSAFCVPPPYSSSCGEVTVYVYEYLNDHTQRRVLLNDPVELDFVDRGLAGPGWHRTSLVLIMLPPTFGTGARFVDICRFYAPSVNSHFFSANAFECSLLKEPGTGWIFERVAFTTDPPVNGACPAMSPYPVYRYYNNRAVFNDTTHRYSPDRSLKTRLEAEGWIDEGIAFCAVRWAETPKATYVISSERPVEQGMCVNEPVAYRGCVEINQQAPMTRVIPADQACMTAAFYRRTGICYDVHTAQTATSPSEVALHSFLQTAPPMLAFAQYGIYVNASDINSATIPATSVNPKYQFYTLPPPDAAVADFRVMPWKDGVARDVELSFSAMVKTLRRGPDGHAISHPAIELIDTSSRRNLYITIGTISGEPQSDFAALDFGVGKPIISTLFRQDPAFGVRLAGDTFICNTDITDSACPQGDNTSFRFRLRPTDIATIVARARILDPLLSPDISDYAIDNFSFNSEVSGEAEIGLHLSNYRLEIYAR